QDGKPSFYLYSQVMGSHRQIGVAAAVSCEDYLSGVIKKHEFTRPDKEDDRVRHIEALNSQTGPVFLIYRASKQQKDLLGRLSAEKPDIDFTAPDGVRHTAWVVTDAEAVRQIEHEFTATPELYIADGHHRSAAAGRVYQTRKGAGHSALFLAVIFPHDQVQI